MDQARTPIFTLQDWTQSHLSTARGLFRAHIPIKGKSMSGYFSLFNGWVQGPCQRACQKSCVHFIEIVNVDNPFFSLYNTVRAYQSLQFLCTVYMSVTSCVRSRLQRSHFYNVICFKLPAFWFTRLAPTECV